MIVIVTKRANGNVRVGTNVEKHGITQIPIGDDEIIDQLEFDLPTAYKTETGLAYTNFRGQTCAIEDHPAIRAWVEGRLPPSENAAALLRKK